MLAKQNVQTPGKFAKGDAVRVRSGVADPDFPDVPLGGWAGTIIDVEPGDPRLYLIRWSEETLQRSHPVYRKRCDRDGLEVAEMSLAGKDLELDSGGELIIEQPTQIIVSPLSMRNQDDRVRSVFGLTRDDPLPAVDDAALRSYYKHLAANLTFPFEARWQEEPDGGRSEKVTVLALAGSAEDPSIDDMQGILCNANRKQGQEELPLAEMAKPKGGANKQLVEDYAYWFWNNF